MLGQVKSHRPMQPIHIAINTAGYHGYQVSWVAVTFDLLQCVIWCLKALIRGMPRSTANRCITTETRYCTNSGKTIYLHQWQFDGGIPSNAVSPQPNTTGDRYQGCLWHQTASAWQAAPLSSAAASISNGFVAVLAISCHRWLVGWGLMALSTQFRSYRAYKVKTIL